MAEQFRQGVYAGIHANPRLGMAEQIQTTPSRAYLEQRRNENQPVAAPGTGLWTPNQASELHLPILIFLQPIKPRAIITITQQTSSRSQRYSTRA